MNTNIENNPVQADPVQEYVIADISLASWGRKEIAIAG